MIDLEGTRMFIQNGMMQSLTLVLLLVVATTMMFSTDWVMALLGLSLRAGQHASRWGGWATCCASPGCGCRT